jgi:hypothetical protein
MRKTEAIQRCTASATLALGRDIREFGATAKDSSATTRTTDLWLIVTTTDDLWLIVTTADDLWLILTTTDLHCRRDLE